MNNFKQPPRGRRQTMDGIIGTPPRQPLSSRHFIRRNPTSEGSAASGHRQVGDFRRAEGYHPVSKAPVNSARPMSSINGLAASGEPSMLHASLPAGKKLGGGLKFTDKDKKKKRRFHINWRSKKFWLRSGLATVGLILIIGGFLFAQGYFNLHKVFKGGGSAAALDANINPSKLKGEGDGRVNILLLGRGGDGHEGADLTDTLLVASIDPINNKAALVSLPRDFWTNTTYGASKVNAIFANSKDRALAQGNDTKKAEAIAAAAVEKEVSDILGIPMHYYSLVDFTAFQQAVDTVGGVDINITDQTAVSDHMYNEATGKPYFLNVPTGMQHFDGTRALFFTRTRHTSARGDFDRAERQRLFIQALAQKVASIGTFTNPVKVSQLMSNFGNHVATDMSIDDGIRLTSIIKKIGNKYDSVDLADPTTPLIKTGSINGQSVVLPVAGVDDYSQIQALIRNKMRDGYLAKENANVTVLNGTDMPGLAAKKADQLKSYGYNVGTVGDAPSHNFEKTVIVDLTKGKMPYTKNYLEKRFGLKVTTQMPDQSIQAGTANFVIILGDNETTNSQN
jgi:polyisoprenyl-teichoic acid--peptidoglycan teichoic acid transferase